MSISVLLQGVTHDLAWETKPRETRAWSQPSITGVRIQLDLITKMLADNDSFIYIESEIR